MLRIRASELVEVVAVGDGRGQLLLVVRAARQRPGFADGRRVSAQLWCKEATFLPPRVTDGGSRHVSALFQTVSLLLAM